jgi:hypothetical protein
VLEALMNNEWSRILCQKTHLDLQQNSTKFSFELVKCLTYPIFYADSGTRKGDVQGEDWELGTWI